MASEIKIHYDNLNEDLNRLEQFRRSLESVRVEMGKNAQLLADQRGNVFHVLTERREILDALITNQLNEINDLHRVLGDFTTKMNECIHPSRSSAFVRARPYDVKHNITQIRDAVEDGHKNGYWLMEQSGGYWTLSGGELVQDEERIEKEKRNGAKIDELKCQLRVSQRDCVPVLDELDRIYRDHVLKFQQTDGDCVAAAIALYKNHTSALEAVTAQNEAQAKAGVEMLQGFWASVVGFGKGVLSLLEILGAACVVSAVSSNEWANAKIDGLHETMEHLKDIGLGGLLEGIGQSIADTYEEKGFAYVAGGAMFEAITLFAAPTKLGKVGKAVEAAVEGIDSAADAAKGIGKIDDAVDAAKGIDKATDAEKFMDGAETKIDDAAGGAKVRKYTDSEIEDILNELQGTDFKNHPLRQAYEAEVLNLRNVGEELLASGIPKEDVARTLHQMRRDLGIKYKDATPQPLRNYIYELNEGRYNGDKLGPSFEDLAKKKSYDEIIESASTPNNDISALLSNFEQWLRLQ